MIKSRSLIILAGLAAAIPSVYAGNATLSSLTTFSGNVALGGSGVDDWIVFSPIANSGSPVRMAGGPGLISGVTTDGGVSPAFGYWAGPASFSWSGGNPVAASSGDAGFLSVDGGYDLPNYTVNPTYADVTVTSPSTDYTVNLFINNWGFGYDLDVAVSNGGSENTYNQFATDYGWTSLDDLTISVTGATVGSLTTIDFSNITGDPDFGQLGFFAAEVTNTPEPTTLALCGLGLAGLRFIRRRN